jgi:radical SAM superfamily enzyme YgiQ (UPF0313 family)
MANYFFLNLPSPPGRNIYRAFAGGFGTLGGSSKDDVLFPLFLLYAVSAAEELKVEFKVLDAQAEGQSLNQVIDAVKNHVPDVLIAWPSLPSLEWDINTLKEIKKASPKTLVIGLGTSANVLSREVLGAVDLIVKGFYPYYHVILEIIQTLEDKGLAEIDSLISLNGAIHVNGGKTVENDFSSYSEEIDRLNLDAYHKLPVKKYTAQFLDKSYNYIDCIPILTGVGCPYGCAYCPYPLGYGNKIVNKSIKKIIEEIEFLNSSFGIKGFVFREQAFTHSKKRVIELCDEIIRKDLNIKWLVETRADLVDRETLMRMKEAGCFRIHYGVETGDPNLLKSVGKPRLGLDKIRSAFTLTKENDIFAHAHLMIGFPEENEDSINRSIQFIGEIEPDSVNINIVTPYPGTEFYDEVIANGHLSNQDWSLFTSFEPISEIRYLESEDLKKARKKIKRQFYKIKIRKDPEFRTFFMKQLPRKLWNKFRR